MVRSTVGAYAGELREFPVHVARRLVADGRAELPDTPGVGPNRLTAEIEPEPPPKVKPRKRRKKWNVR